MDFKDPIEIPCEFQGPPIEMPGELYCEIGGGEGDADGGGGGRVVGDATGLSLGLGGISISGSAASVRRR